jgi:NAD(P)-dependent dehydrogenase (short-subunit alcohol dehydrogenase family)
MQRRPPGIHVDFASFDSIVPAWLQALDEFDGPPDVVILNAGEGCTGAFDKLDDSRLQGHIQLNLIAPVVVARESIRSWLKFDRPGHVIFVGSQAGLPGSAQAENAIYSACKSALHGIVGALAAEYGPTIRINAIAPGDVPTPLAEQAIERMAAATDQPAQAIRDEVAAKAPIGRWVAAKEVAQSLLFLDQCEAMNGTILNISGGRTIH